MEAPRTLYLKQHMTMMDIHDGHTLKVSQFHDLLNKSYLENFAKSDTPITISLMNQQSFKN